METELVVLSNIESSGDNLIVNCYFHGKITVDFADIHIGETNKLAYLSTHTSSVYGRWLRRRAHDDGQNHLTRKQQPEVTSVCALGRVLWK